MSRTLSRLRVAQGFPRARSIASVDDFHRRGSTWTFRNLPSIHVISIDRTFGGQRRFFSDNADDSSPSVDETLDKLFLDAQQHLTSGTDAFTSAWEPTWYNLADQAIVSVNAFHDLTGLEYGWSIFGVTVILRLALFPLMVQSQMTTSRMAHVQPELNMMKQRYEAIGTPSRQDQLQFSKNIKALFAKYQVNPMRAFVAPLVQLPLFMGMFFGLRKMPSIFPEEFSTGGMFWFVDLTVPDPLYILPVASAVTFLALIEMGKEQMMAQNAQQGKLFINVFRAMSLVMLPVCISFESAMLVYWTSNNLLSMGQTQILKTPAFRKYFGIWDPPKPVPGLETESLSEAAGKIIKTIQGEATSEKQQIQQHNKTVEVKKKARAFQMLRRETRKGRSS